MAVVSGDGVGVGSVGTIVYTTIVNIAAGSMGGEHSGRLPLQPPVQISI